jgi:hypothetical protein
MNACMSWRTDRLRTSAVTEIDALEVDELEAKSKQLAAAAYERRTGKAIKPDDILLNPILDEEDFVAAREQVEDQVYEYLTSLRLEEAALANCARLLRGWCAKRLVRWMTHY